MKKILHILWMIPALLALAATEASSGADDSNLQLYEKKIQSGLVYNFLKYTSWPATTGDDQPFRVCIYGQRDPFEGHLNPISGRTAQQRKIVLQYVTKQNIVTDCHLLIVSGDETEEVSTLLNQLKSHSILTVSDIHGFAAAGGMIEFARKNGNIAVNINAKAVENARLKINERMLALANVVY